MNAQETDYRRNIGGKDSQALARIACIARYDTFSGSARALVLVARADALNLPLARDMNHVVTEVYTNGFGQHEYTCHECYECGSVHYGCEAAMYCCTGEGY